MTAEIVRLPSMRLPNLCRLFAFEDDAEREFQHRSMTAAAEVYRWYAQTDVWQSELQAIRDREAAETGLEPRWSATSDRGFHKWVGMEVEKAGYSIRRNQVMNLFNAEAMRQVTLKVVTGVTTLPTTEGAWRPAMRLYSKGFKAEVAEAVQLAVDIAEQEGAGEITAGIMRAAVAQVWKTSPRIRDWVEQPDQVGNRSHRDRMVTLLNDAKHAVEQLRAKGDDSAWQQFLTWVEERAS